MFCITMRCDYNFEAVVVLGQFECGLVRLRWRDIFLRREALRVVVEESAFGLFVRILRCREFCVGRFGAAVFARDKFYAVGHTLFVLPDVVQCAAKGCPALALARDKVHCCHQLRSPVRARILSSTAAKSCLTSSSRRAEIRPILHRVVS